VKQLSISLDGHVSSTRATGLSSGRTPPPFPPLLRTSGATFTLTLPAFAFLEVRLKLGPLAITHLM
jgi:hypothetical protein